jgi:dTDP-4-dehydrorhamnose 3,5-epimerase
VEFKTTSLPPVTVVQLEPVDDERGSFARTWCADEFAAAGLNPGLSQTSVSTNRRRGTLRGLHYQAAPYEEAKLVRCAKGAIFDVAVDLRPDSPTYLRWFGLELTESNGQQLYVPEGFAHGFQTLCDDTVVTYAISVPYAPGSGRGIRYDDATVGVRWPLPDPIVSDRDLGLPPAVA